MTLVLTTPKKEQRKGLGAWVALEQRRHHLGCHLQPCLPGFSLPCLLLYSCPGTEGSRTCSQWLWHPRGDQIYADEAAQGGLEDLLAGKACINISKLLNVLNKRPVGKDWPDSLELLNHQVLLPAPDLLGEGTQESLILNFLHVLILILLDLMLAED